MVVATLRIQQKIVTIDGTPGTLIALLLPVTYLISWTSYKPCILK